MDDEVGVRAGTGDAVLRVVGAVLRVADPLTGVRAHDEDVHRSEVGLGVGGRLKLWPVAQGLGDVEAVDVAQFGGVGNDAEDQRDGQRSNHGDAAATQPRVLVVLVALCAMLMPLSAGGGGPRRARL